MVTVSLHVAGVPSQIVLVFVYLDTHASRTGRTAYQHAVRVVQSPTAIIDINALPLANTRLNTLSAITQALVLGNRSWYSSSFTHSYAASIRLIYPVALTLLAVTEAAVTTTAVDAFP